MIVKIQPPNPHIMAAVRYNENKMKGIEGTRENDTDVKGIEEGHVLTTRNLTENESLTEAFARLERQALKQKRNGPKLQNSAFHMSINPSDNDRKLNEIDVVALADEIMSGLGYGNQPYRIYKHTDIPREHYHIVSCRIGNDGKKIDDSFERIRLRKLLRSLEEKYGFEIILNEYEKEHEPIKENRKKDAASETNKTEKKIEEKKETPGRNYVLPFSRKREEPVVKQIKDAVEDALKWHFSTFEQLQILMLLRYNVAIEVEKNENDGHVVTFGTNEKGEPVTTPIFEEQFMPSLMQTITEKIYKEKMHNRREQRERLEKLARAAAKASGTYDDFIRIMKEKGVWLILSWKKGTDDAFGVTYLDRATKCAWKGSETAVNLDWLKETARTKGWTLTKNENEQHIQKRNAMPSRKNLTRKTDFEPVPLVQAGNKAKGRRGIKPIRGGAGHNSSADITKENDLVKKKDDDKNNVKYIGE